MTKAMSKASNKNSQTYVYEMTAAEICATVKTFMDSGLWEGDKVEFLHRFMHGWATAETLEALVGNDRRWQREANSQ